MSCAVHDPAQKHVHLKLQNAIMKTVINQYWVQPNEQAAKCHIFTLCNGGTTAHQGTGQPQLRQEGEACVRAWACPAAVSRLRVSAAATSGSKSMPCPSFLHHPRLLGHPSHSALTPTLELLAVDLPHQPCPAPPCPPKPQPKCQPLPVLAPPSPTLLSSPLLPTTILPSPSQTLQQAPCFSQKLDSRRLAIG